MKGQGRVGDGGGGLLFYLQNNSPRRPHTPRFSLLFLHRGTKPFISPESR